MQKKQVGAKSLEFGSIRRQLMNIKQEKYPKTPTCFPDIIKLFQNDNVMKEFGMSKYEENKQFYIDTVIDEDFSYSIFASPTICSAIRDMTLSSQPRNYIIDGTFNVVPISKQFKQLLIFHIQLSDHAYPFIYVLLSHKSQNSYSHLFQYIHTNILNLNPTTVITDFEASLRNAIKHVYPDVSMKSCWFHYANALRRKALQIPNFIKKSNRDRELKRLFQKFLILPLLKPNDIKDAFKILQEDAHTLESRESCPQLHPFLAGCFDPFKETQKALAELIENEEEHNIGRTSTKLLNHKLANNIYQPQQQNMIEYMQRSRMPPPGFSHVNNFNGYGVVPRIQNSKVMSFMNLSNNYSPPTGQHIQHPKQLQIPSNTWGTHFGNYQQHINEQQIRQANQIPSGSNLKGYTGNDWTAMDPAILSFRQFSFPHQTPQIQPQQQEMFLQQLAQQQQQPGFTSQSQHVSGGNVGFPNNIMNSQQSSQTHVSANVQGMLEYLKTRQFV